MRKGVTIAIAAMLLFSIAYAFTSYAYGQETHRYRVETREGLKIIYSDYIVVAVPAEGKKPIFLWWRPEDNKTVYVMMYHSLAEVWLPEELKKPGKPAFSHKYIVEQGDVEGLLKGLFEKAGIGRLIEKGKKAEEKGNECIRAIERMLAGPPSVERLEEIKEELSELREYASEIDDEALRSKVLSLIDELTSSLNELVKTAPRLSMRELMLRLREVADKTKDVVSDTIGYYHRYRELFNRAVKHLASRPIVFPLVAGEWSLSGPTEIKLPDGTTIGLEFTWTLARAPKAWAELEGNIVIRNRLYFKTVEETVKNVTYVVKAAELKSDIVVKKWRWVYDELSKEDLKINVSKYVKPYLVLRVKFTALEPVRGLGALAKEVLEEELTSPVKAGLKVISGGKALRLGEPFDEDLEFEAKEYVVRGTRVRMPELIIGENATVGGFFRFVPYATVTYPDGTWRRVNVTGFFWPTWRVVVGFLVYPYFDGGTLEHDPSIGLVSTVEEEPIAKVTITEAGTAVTKPYEEAAQPTPVAAIDYYHYVLLAVAVVVALAVAIKLKK